MKTTLPAPADYYRLTRARELRGKAVGRRSVRVACSLLLTCLLVCGAVAETPPRPRGEGVPFSKYPHADPGFPETPFACTAEEWCTVFIDQPTHMDYGRCWVGSPDIATRFHQFLGLVNHAEVERLPVATSPAAIPRLSSSDRQLAYALKLWSWARRAEGKQRMSGWRSEGERAPGPAEVGRRFGLAAAGFRMVLDRFPQARLAGSYARLGLGLSGGPAPYYRSEQELRQVGALYPEFPERAMRADWHRAELCRSLGRKEEAAQIYADIVKRHRHFRHWSTYHRAKESLAALSKPRSSRSAPSAPWPGAASRQ
jgi:hypothetical protein